MSRALVQYDKSVQVKTSTRILPCVRRGLSCIAGWQWNDESRSRNVGVYRANCRCKDSSPRRSRQLETAEEAPETIKLTV